MGKPAPGTTPEQQAVSYGITNMQRHILLCAGPECAEPARGEIAWNYLKKRIAELKLDRQPTGVFRTRCHCLRICTKGPILCMQPDGVWYHSADPEVIERILLEHVLEGRRVEEFIFASQPLEPE
jgi:(2Fe-2S) ferredoxin